MLLLLENTNIIKIAQQLDIVKIILQSISRKFRKYIYKPLTV